MAETKEQKEAREQAEREAAIHAAQSQDAGSNAVPQPVRAEPREAPSLGLVDALRGALGKAPDPPNGPGMGPAPEGGRYVVGDQVVDAFGNVVKDADR